MSHPQEPPPDPQEPPSEPQPTSKIKRGKSKSRAHRQRKHRMGSEPQQQQQNEPQLIEPIFPQDTGGTQATEPSPLVLQKAIEELCREVHPPRPDVHTPGAEIVATNEKDALAALSNYGYIIPAHSTLSSPLFLIKKDTSHLEIFNALIEHMSAQLSKVKEELLKPSMGEYAWKEKVMMQMLTEVVPRIAGLAMEVGVEVTEALRVNGGKIRLFVGGESEVRDKEIEGELEEEVGAIIQDDDGGQAVMS